MNPQKIKTVAAVMTGREVAAISSICMAGPGAVKILGQVFETVSERKAEFDTGKILRGHIVDGSIIVDDCLIGCEGQDSFSINCHGNPLIVENILELLKKYGAEIVKSDKLMMILAVDKYGTDTIAAEARAEAVRAKTVSGAKIISHQTVSGLKQTCLWWRSNLEIIDIADIAAGAEKILSDTRTAQLIISRARAVLAGAPNSGKSTLFNRLCGRQKAIVTNIAGTTRDWLSANIRIGNIVLELFDTAGIDESCTAGSSEDAQSRQRAEQLTADCDIVLAVVDASKKSGTVTAAGRKTLVVLNKSDLGCRVDVDSFENAVCVSAADGSGISDLLAAIEIILGTADFDFKTTVCFTRRQTEIMKKIASTETKEKIKGLVTELLTGQIFI